MSQSSNFIPQFIATALGLIGFAAILIFMVRKARKDQTFHQPDDPGAPSPGSGGGGKPPKGSGPIRPV